MKTNSRYLPTFRSFFIDVVCFKVDNGPVSLDSVSDVEWISKALSFSWTSNSGRTSQVSLSEVLSKGQNLRQHTESTSRKSPFWLQDIWACDKRSITKNVSPFWPKSTVILTNTKWPDDFYIVCISLSTKKCPMAKKHIFLCIFFRFYLGLCRLWRWSQPTWLKIEFERYTKKESIFCHWTLVCTYTNTNNIKIIKSFCICQY